MKKNLHRHSPALSAIAAGSLALTAFAAFAHSAPGPAALAPGRFTKGRETLAAFAPVAEAMRHSIAKIDVDGRTVALAAVIQTNARASLAITKASELRPGTLTSWLAGGREVPADRVAVDETHDVALIRIHANDLVPIKWSAAGLSVGQWVVTPGIEATPHAVGVLSAPARRIPPERVFLGIILDMRSPSARVEQILPGFGAEKAGLQPGDRILAVDDFPVETREELIRRLQDYRAGNVVNIRALRDEQEMEFEVELKSAPEGPARRPDREERMNQMGGDVSERARGFSSVLQHDTVLPPWLCGGPLANLEGEAIGLNVARAGRVATYALPADLVRKVVAELIPHGPSED
jgi:serine protease Do